MLHGTHKPWAPCGEVRRIIGSRSLDNADRHADGCNGLSPDPRLCTSCKPATLHVGRIGTQKQDRDGDTALRTLPPRYALHHANSRRTGTAGGLDRVVRDAGLQPTRGLMMIGKSRDICWLDSVRPRETSPRSPHRGGMKHIHRGAVGCSHLSVTATDNRTFGLYERLRSHRRR
ncbi:hypothetical protein FA95DRAFT_478899 [Auriscalpium vulgare]|uniref:Uncharacterized protein n=1 Tax=Auriscalpium vulgare TaxID=40419 RepID=A0ACB8SB91_9AGAM|nr:hypothetical protein FA95DRAFT_478899 [Auriscalpium vulgare]